MILLTRRTKTPFQIDEGRYDEVSRHTWSIDAAGYPKTKTWRNGKYRPVRLHLFLFGTAPAGLEWDHENRDKLDNRAQNLRCVTHLVNIHNRKLYINRSLPSGVALCSDSRYKRWRAYIRVRGHNIEIGKFRTAEEAIAARISAEAERDLYLSVQQNR